MLEKNVQKCQEKAKHFDGQLWEKYEWHLDPEYVYNKLVDQEDCSRRNNLRINDVKKKDGESWEACKAKVEKPFSERN